MIVEPEQICSRVRRVDGFDDDGEVGEVGDAGEAEEEEAADDWLGSEVDLSAEPLSRTLSGHVRVWESGPIGRS